MCAKVKYAAVMKCYKGRDSLNNLSALEGDKSEKVVKTNVWVKIKRKRKYLQGFEDNFKEG